MARKKAGAKSGESAKEALFTLVRDAKSSIVEVTTRDTGAEPADIEVAFDHILDLIAAPEATPARVEAFRTEGVRLSRAGTERSQVLDAYLSLNWAIWETVMADPSIPTAAAFDLADRLMRGTDSAIAALADGYIVVEVELAAAHSEQRRAVLEELLTAPRSTPEDRTRIRRRAERHGLGGDDGYRLVLVLVPGHTDEAQSEAIDRIESLVRAPVSHHRERQGIRLPVVMEWRGRILVFARAEWVGEDRLRKALPTVLDHDWVAIDTGLVDGIEPLADALAEAEYSAGVAANLGRRGWIGNPEMLAMETTFLLDEALVQSAIEQELGPLLADERMGEEFIETLEVYFGSRMNIQETARRLHLASRTVAYRLDRIEKLLGRELEGDPSARIGVALVALRVTRQAGKR